MPPIDWSYLFLSFDGRIGRRLFWIGFVVAAGADLVCRILVYQFDDGARMSPIVSLAFLYPEFAVFAKRGQDRDISVYIPGAFFLLSTVLDFLVILGLGGSLDAPSAVLLMLAFPWMIFALALLFELGLRPGTPGPNRYGPDPLARP